MSDNVARYPLPRVRRAAASFAAAWNRIGDQTAFYVKSIASTRDAVLYYKGEIARLIAQMSLGVGALAVIGGTVVIIILLTGSVGGLVAIQGYTSLGSIGVEALTGFFSAYVQVRFSTPAIAAIGYAGRQGEHLIAVENTPDLHNMVVCTLCSCYPWPVLGLPPVWYKSAPYRNKAVKDPRGVLADFGFELPQTTKIRVWDSTAEIRYLVLPMRPAGTEGWSEERLAELVTRDSMIGTGLPKQPHEVA